MVLPSEDKDEIAKPESAWALLKPWGLTPDNARLERSAVYRFQARWDRALAQRTLRDCRGRGTPDAPFCGRRHVCGGCAMQLLCHGGC